MQCCSVGELWWTNMMLLGFKSSQKEQDFKVVFNAAMFSTPNKKGGEVVLHFLLETLQPGLTELKFRSCWPVVDKQSEQEFRKLCSNILGEIAKQNPDTRLPRLCSSLLMSPGGDKYYNFLYKLSKHVLLKVTLAKAEKEGVFVSSFLTNGLSSDSDKMVSREALKAHTVRNCMQTVERLGTQTQLHSVWQEESSSLVKQYYSECKVVKDLKDKLGNVRKVARERHGQSSEKVLNLQMEVTQKKRKAQLDKTRKLWASVLAFAENGAPQREIMDSVLGNDENATIDSRSMEIHVPDALMGDYEAMVSSGTCLPLYSDGKLNIITLFKLYNSALRKFLATLKQHGLPQGEVSEDLIQQHKTLLSTVTQLRSQLIELKESVTHSVDSRLTEQYQQLNVTECVFTAGQAPKIAIACDNLPSVGLLPLSPGASEGTIGTPQPAEFTNGWTLSHPQADLESTPEAIRSILASVHDSVAMSRESRTPQRLPQSSRKQLPKTKSAMSTGHPAKPVSAIPSHIPTRSNKQTKSKDKGIDRPKQKTIEQHELNTPVETSSTHDSINTVYNTLADQIAESVSSQNEKDMLEEPSPATPEDQLHSVTNPMSALGQSAFVSKNLIPRTPIKTAPGTASGASPLLIATELDHMTPKPVQPMESPVDFLTGTPLHQMPPTDLLTGTPLVLQTPPPALTSWQGEELISLTSPFMLQPLDSSADSND